MSHYFRTAAKCDRTIAAAAPVPLYNEPSEEHLETGEPSLPSDVEAMEFGDRLAAAMLPVGTFERSRAVLDHKDGTEARLQMKREANVLLHLSKREETMRQRLEKERELTDRILNIRNEHFAGRSVEDAVTCVDPNPVSTTAVSAVAVPEEPLRNGGWENRLTGGGPADPYLSSTTAALVTALPTQIPVFDMIKIEEQRHVRRELMRGESTASYGGSIVALYNSLTLDALSETNPETPPSLLVKEKEDRFIPGDVADLTSQSYGASLYSTTESKTAELRQALHQKHKLVAEAEQADAAKRENLRRIRDHESMTVMKEVIEHDATRRTLMKETELFAKAQWHEYSLIGSFSVGDRVDPTMPQLPENVKRAVSATKRPVHPIDSYQSAIRADILGDDKLLTM